MKQIDASYKQKIVDLISEQDLTITEYALEKDFIVTDVLKAISSLKPTYYDLVFCGGTCLSKSHRLLDRLSEDIDIKLVPKESLTALNRTQRKNERSAIKAVIQQALRTAGFPEESIELKARDENKYIEFTAKYQTHFDISEPMRAHLKLELNEATLSAPAQPFSMGYEFYALMQKESTVKVQMNCVSVEQAVVEKLLSFPRRLALHLQSNQQRPFDQTLVRHLYDVAVIAGKCGDSLDVERMKPMFLAAMKQDAIDFSAQHPQYVAKPVQELMGAMKRCAENKYEALYDGFVAAMVYSSNKPSFKSALTVFSKYLTDVLPAPTTTFTNLPEIQAQQARAL